LFLENAKIRLFCCFKKNSAFCNVNVNMKLDLSFYKRSDVTLIARELLGKVLVTKFNRELTSGIIVETEAYSSVERGCHAFDSRMTDRNSVMFEEGGISYVYLCYGIHHLFNVVTNVKGEADAVLIRALEPDQGTRTMQKRSLSQNLNRITAGPGKLTKALGIERIHNGVPLSGNKIWIEELGNEVLTTNVLASPRIGIDFAGKDALLPWRFSIRNNAWVSK
jgi:DNA-3-methyladenine glycosylase (3mg)